MQIIPVIDLKNGHVVRGIAGQRDQYQPIQSQLTTATDPLNIAKAFREYFGLTQLYLADLDAIQHEQPHFSVYQELHENGFKMWIDAGLRDLKLAHQLFDANVNAVIVGLETTPGPTHIAELVQTFGAERIIFSLDLQNGQPLGNLHAWNLHDQQTTEQTAGWQIAQQCFAAGIRRMIVLDLSGVGMENGVPTQKLCEQLRAESPELELITGGGIRHRNDLHTLNHAQINAVLIASALHNGTITANDLQPF